MMKRFAFALVCAFVGLSASADPGTTEAVSYTDQTNLIERFRYIERLDVTAEKDPAPADQVEPVSADIEAILGEAELAETE